MRFVPLITAALILCMVLPGTMARRKSKKKSREKNRGYDWQSYYVTNDYADIGIYDTLVLQMTELKTTVQSIKATLDTKCDATTCSNNRASTTDLENCLGDVSSSDCPSSPSGKTGLAVALAGTSTCDTSKTLDNIVPGSTAKVPAAMADLEFLNMKTTASGSGNSAPSKVNSSEISSSKEQDHCCQFRTLKNSAYNLTGVLLTSEIVQKYGCWDNCAFQNIDTPEEFVCFTSSSSECIEASEDFKAYSQQAEQNRVKFQTLLSEKTEQYGQLHFPNLTAKLKYIRQDIYSNLQDCERAPKVLMSNYAFSKLPKQPDLPLEINQYIGNLMDVYNTQVDQDDLLNNLDPLEFDLKSNYHNNYHQISHFLIQNTRMISEISKSKDEGGDDGINGFWQAVMANTGQLDTHIKQFSMATSCDPLGDTLTGTAGGCLGGPEGCAVGAISGAVTGVASCAAEAIENACFAATSLVETTSGVKKISELVIGDFIRTSSPSDGFRTHFTEFLGWLDRQMSAHVKMLQVSTTKGQSTLTLTASHVVFTEKDTKYAGELKPGDLLMHWNGTHTIKQEVTEIKKTSEIGALTPLTRDGTLLVNGYLASCYASFPHQMADLAMIPVKAMPKLLLENEESQHMDGVRAVVKVIKKAGELIGLRKVKKDTNEFPSSATDRPTQFGQFIAKTEF